MNLDIMYETEFSKWLDSTVFLWDLAKESPQKLESNFCKLVFSNFVLIWVAESCRHPVGTGVSKEFYASELAVHCSASVYMWQHRVKFSNLVLEYPIPAWQPKARKIQLWEWLAWLNIQVYTPHWKWQGWFISALELFCWKKVVWALWGTKHFEDSQWQRRDQKMQPKG